VEIESVCRLLLLLLPAYQLKECIAEARQRLLTSIPALFSVDNMSGDHTEMGSRVYQKTACDNMNLMLKAR
jgi:hypothetical protein